MKQSRKNAGMTLVELMMATALAAIVMVPIGTLIVTSLREPMIQQELFFKEASIQESVHLLREKIRNAAITNITLIHGENGDGIQFNQGHGETSSIYKNGPALILDRNDSSIALIERGVEEFSITTSSNLYRITLAVSPLPDQAAIPYTLICSQRN